MLQYIKFGCYSQILKRLLSKKMRDLYKIPVLKRRIHLYLVKDVMILKLILEEHVFFSGVGLTSPGTAATSGLLYSPR
jgi:hypothetical protein